MHHWWAGETEQLLWETVWRFLKQLKTELPGDPTTVLLSKYPKESKAGSQRDTGRLLSTAVLFTIAKRWGQLKCPSTNEQKEKMRRYPYTGISVILYKENPGKDEPRGP